MKKKNQTIDSEKIDTWPKLLSYNNEKYHDDRPAFRYKKYGIWHRYSWQDYYRNVKSLSLGLLSMGFSTGDKLAISGDNSSEWYFSALAAQSNNGVIVGLSPELSPAEIKHIVANAEVRFAVVEDQEQVDKFLEIISELPLLKKIIYWNYKGLAHYSEPYLAGFKEVLELGDQHEKTHRELFETNIKSAKSDNICTIVYTAGTTQFNPKGVVHTYRTMKSGAEYLLSLDEWHRQDNVVFSLPPVGITEQWLGIGCHLITGNTLNFAEQSETQQLDFREIGPEIVYYPAQLWENLAGSVQTRIHNAGTIERFAFRILMPAGYRMSPSPDGETARPGLRSKIFYSLANLLLFSPVKDSLGLLKAKVCRTGGTILSPETIKFYRALNITLKNIYGTTECGGICGVIDAGPNQETMGTIPQGTEIRITGNGELICRQAGICTGYYRNIEETNKALRNGWFHTGDLAEIGKSGYVIFKGKKQETFKLASGDSISPELIESRLKSSPHIKNVWLLNCPGKDFLAAVIIINYGNVSKWADRQKIRYTTFSDLSQKPAVYELITAEIRHINETLPKESRIKKYVNLYKEFDPDEGELTRTGKLRRWFLAEHYSQLITDICGDKTELPIDTQILYRDGRVGTIKTTIHVKTVEENASL